MRLFLPLTLALLVVATSPAQLLINEVHGFGGGASPVLPGDYIEIWNQSSSNIDLAGYSLDIWAGDTGAAQIRVIPSVCGATNTSIVPANGFWIFQEAGVLGDPLTGSLAGLIGMRGMPTNWSSTSNFGARLINPLGNCVDYVYIRRGTTAPPALPPNLVAPCTWTLGNVGTVTSGRAHAQRLTNTNTSSFTDWADSVTATVGTPGAENTILGATQTPTGPLGSVGANFFAFETNDSECSFDVNGATNNGNAPISVVACLADTIVANLASTNVGFGWELAVGVAPAIAAATDCAPGAGGISTPNFQKLNIDLTDPALLFLNGLTFSVAFPGNIALPIIPAGPIANVTGQMAIIAPANLDGFALSAPAQLQITNMIDETRTLTLTDDSTTNVVLSSLCGAPAGINFYGTTYNNLWVNSNGRVMFGAAGLTTLGATIPLALSNNPSVGFWTDLNPTPVGSGPITVSTVGGVVTVTWNGTYYFGTTVPCNYSVVFDPANDDVSLVVNSPFTANPAGLGGGDAQWFGISGGNAVTATDGGPVTFAPASGTLLMPLSTDMIYDFWAGTVATAPNGINLVGSLQNPSLASVKFAWAGTGYTYEGL
jgi:hypothetical protein